MSAGQRNSPVSHQLSGQQCYTPEVSLLEPEASSSRPASQLVAAIPWSEQCNQATAGGHGAAGPPPRTCRLLSTPHPALLGRTAEKPALEAAGEAGEATRGKYGWFTRSSNTERKWLSVSTNDLASLASANDIATSFSDSFHSADSLLQE